MWRLLCLWTVAYEQLTQAECKQSIWERVCVDRNIYQAIETWLEIKLCRSSEVEEVLDEKNYFSAGGRLTPIKTLSAFLSSGQWDKEAWWSFGGVMFLSLCSMMSNLITSFSHSLLNV